ncbi:MAG TPA: helicase-related protein [Stellaceae bacterium]|nr:helicase-related protein [Stellaceae bacterium]
MGPSFDSGRVTAVLGPTNTGKTHLAIERMLGHASGMIGFPLRLLARENYDRIVKLKGAASVALITGEERIVPAHPRWFVCTVESMPLERQVDFLAIDEVQLAGDPERGHVFTDRIRRARGASETMFLGSDTIRPLLKKLVPEAEVISRPRFSTLTYTGPQKVTRLPPRSAVVAFSVADVFELAELVRRQRGGTAVVLGALSPRARNAQVAMYQAGEVDYMVATDAIGMGLNMDLDHVAFARLSKFDGRGPRRLTPPEIAQIAGRAGRHMNNGTFGTTAEAGPMDEEVVEAVEAHRFDPLTMLWWRNTDLNYRSAALLLKSLEARPPYPFLMRAAESDDYLALAALARQPDIAMSATNPARVRLLWEICQIPDFRKIMSEHHARLLGQIYRYLAAPAARLPTDWVAGQISRLDRVDGDIDALVQRIAHIRTWTYITLRSGWLDKSSHWQERARAIEDRLSDALHDRITQRFVDRRSAILVKYLKESRDLDAIVSETDEVVVEGHFVGRMKGLAFEPDPSATGDEMRMLVTAANRILRREVETRTQRLAGDDDEHFEIAADGALLWRGEAVAHLAAGDAPLKPRIDIATVDFLEGAAREKMRHRLQCFVRDTIARTLRPLGQDHAALEPDARGLLYRLGETLGCLDADKISSDISTKSSKLLFSMGVRFGAQAIYLSPLLKPAAVALKALLWSVHHGLNLPAELPPPGRLSIPVPKSWNKGLADAAGYRIAGPWAIRLDRLELLVKALRDRAHQGPFAAEGSLATLAGLPLGELPAILAALGYLGETIDGALLFKPSVRRKHRDRMASKRPKPVAPDHPFAELLRLGSGA